MYQQPKRILIVENSPVQAHSLGRFLSDHGVDVSWALDGKIGVTMARHQLPDLIVLDMDQPGEGLEVYRRLKHGVSTQTIPLVLLTSSEELDLELDEEGTNGCTYIQKSPEYEDTLLEHLRRLEILTEENVSNRT